MEERLSAVAGLVVRAVERRSTERDAPEGRLGAVAAVLREEYGAWSTYADPWLSPPDSDDSTGLLARRFGLDAHETRLLVTAAAGDLDLNLGAAFDALGGRPGHGLPSVGLALELCGLPSATPAGARRLAPQGTLRRHGLVEVVAPAGAEGWLHRLLRVPDRVRRHLLGPHAGGLDPSLANVVVQPVPVSTTVSTDVAKAVLGGAGVVHLHSWPGAAGTSTAATGLLEAGFDPLAVDLSLAPQADLSDLLRAAVLEAGLGGGALVVVGGEVLIASQERRRLLTVLDDAPVPVVLVAHRAWHPEGLPQAPPSLAAPRLSADDRSALWREQLGVELVEDPGSPPVATLRLDPEEIAATAHHARTMAGTRSVPLTARLVREAARVRGEGAGRGEGESTRGPVGYRATFDDLVLPERTLREIRRMVHWASYRDDVVARTQVHGSAGKGTGLAALFTGGPGTGKTLSAHVVADELNLELLQVDLSAVVDKYIGETEKNLERIFVEAESRDVVLFFDEADALFGSRSSVQDARDRYANQEVSYLLQRMEQFDGITVLATNLRGNLDDAFSRRLQFIVHFPDPDAATRERLWRQHLDQAGALDADDPVDVAHLAGTLELAGGDIRNVVLAATYDAAVERAPLGMRHVWEAVVREHRKLGRITPRGPRT